MARSKKNMEERAAKTKAYRYKMTKGKFSTSQVARNWHISEQAVCARMKAAGRTPTRNVGREFYWTPEDMTIAEEVRYANKQAGGRDGWKTSAIRRADATNIRNNATIAVQGSLQKLGPLAMLIQENQPQTATAALVQQGMDRSSRRFGLVDARMGRNETDTRALQEDVAYLKAFMLTPPKRESWLKRIAMAPLRLVQSALGLAP